MSFAIQTFGRVSSTQLVAVKTSNTKVNHQVSSFSPIQGVHKLPLSNLASTFRTKKTAF